MTMVQDSTTWRQVLLPFGIVAAIALIWFVFLRDGGQTSPEARSAQSYVEEYGGDVGVIEVFLGYTDCEVLGRAATAAESNAHAFGLGTARGREQLGRMTAAGDRMDALDCP